MNMGSMPYESATAASPSPAVVTTEDPAAAAIAYTAWPASVTEYSNTTPTEADYAKEVLRTTNDTAEADFDEQLAARAKALGIASDALTHSVPFNGVTPLTTTSVRPNQIRFGSSASTATAASIVTTTMPPPTTDVPTPTSPASSSPPLLRARSKSLTFAQYDKYLAQVDPNLEQPRIIRHTPSASNGAPSLFSVNTRHSYINLKNGILEKVRWKRRKPSRAQTVTFLCICCREEFPKRNDLHTLPCGHIYCAACLRTMTEQGLTDESKMPPRCCTQPIPGVIIKQLLGREEQQAFLKAVLQYSTPWDARVFCPSRICNEFIPPRSKVDPKQPFVATCKQCRNRVCTMCKRGAHAWGQDCPHDWELEAVLNMGEKSGWRRCYKCRNLVELTQGCTHMTCRCKAQFCYICGAVWDNTVGCPNFCNGEEELERRRLEEVAREAEQAAEKAAQEAALAAAEIERQEALKRTNESLEFSRLRDEQEDALRRFVMFERQAKWIMWANQSQKKLDTMAKYTDQIDKMKDRHAKTEQHLEERQIAGEMELRTTLEQAERSVMIRVKHMEAYCRGLGSTAVPLDIDARIPPRVVTERHLRELGQQHNVLDGMARLHQAKINVMRDRQAKRMEELLQRQKEELARLEDKRDVEVEQLAVGFAGEEDVLTGVFAERQVKIMWRWQLEIEILRVELGKARKLKYASMTLPVWPVESPTTTVELTPVLG